MPQQNANIKRILNCIPSRETEKDWRVPAAVGVGLIPAAPPLPAARDLRAGEEWWQIGDQSYTGSCVGWATADSVLRWHFVKAGKLPNNQLLSPRFTWIASKETDEFTMRPTSFIETAGTSLKAALDVSRNYGAVFESVLPFTRDYSFQGEEAVFYATAALYKIISYFNLGLNLNDWRLWLGTRGPILTRLDVDDTWFNATTTGGNLDVYNRPPSPAGHAVALVGYTPDRFIIRNSWGSSWGDQGYGYASLAYAQAAFTEAYGVIV